MQIDFQLERDAFGRLVLIDAEGQRHEGIVPVRAFPLSAPGEGLSLVGADGLGVPVVRALNQVNTALGFESGFIIVVVAIVLDRMLRIRRE